VGEVRDWKNVCFELRDEAEGIAESRKAKVSQKGVLGLVIHWCAMMEASSCRLMMTVLLLLLLLLLLVE